MKNLFGKACSLVLIICVNNNLQATPKEFSVMSCTEKASYVAALARGATTFAAHATDHAVVQCTNDMVRIADSVLALWHQRDNLGEAAISRALEILVSAFSFKNHVAQTGKDAAEKRALMLPDRPTTFAVTSLVAGLAFGMLEGWQALRLARNDFGYTGLAEQDALLVHKYENSKLTFMRTIENLVINSPFYQVTTELSKGSLLVWGGALVVNLDRMLGHSALVEKIKQLELKK